MTDEGRTVVLYDTDCGFCRWSAERLRRRDRRGGLRFVPIQGAEGDRLLAGVEKRERLSTWHVLTRDGRLHTAGAGLAPVLDELPRGRTLATIARRAPRSAEALYRYVARHRDAIDRVLGVDACTVDPSRPAGGP